MNVTQIQWIIELLERIAIALERIAENIDPEAKNENPV